MAVLQLHMNFNSASIPTQTPIPNKTANPLLKLSQKPGTLRDAFSYLKERLYSTPNECLDEAYSSVLDHCAGQNSLSLGKQIHALVLKRNNARHIPFLSTKLVFMYGKCGSFLDAEHLFDEMPERSIFTYNAMLGAYVSNSQPWKAIELYAGMRVLDISGDAHTCSCILKAVAEAKDICSGKEIHAYAFKLGLVYNGIAVNSLVSMYSSCNDLNSAVLLFDRSDKGDVVLWNLMISAYSNQGMSHHALRLFEEMHSAGIVPSTYTFVAVIQACEELLFGMQIHALVLKSGFGFDRYVTNGLVVMYSKCSKIDEAERVFAGMRDKDNISWNSMLDAYVQNGLYDRALDFSHEMTGSGQKPDQVSVISLLSACGRSGNLVNGMEVHAFALKNRMEQDLQVGNTIIDMYAKFCKTSYMDSAFQRIPRKDSISWTTIIAGYVQNHFYLKALQLFREAQLEGIFVDKLMIESVLLACRGLKCVSIAKEIHGYVIRGEASDVIVMNTFLDVYGECGKLDYARNIFGLIEVKNVVTWTSMIDSYIHNGLANEALVHSFYMVQSGVELDPIALLSILSATANLSALRKGKEIHGYLFRRNLYLGESFASSLVDMYAKCGDINKSYMIFNSIQDKDLVLWTNMISAYGMHGQGAEAIKLFKEMETEGHFADHITFLALLYACSHSALVDEGKRIFNIMQNKYGLEPWPEHYACLVDLIGRASYLEEAFELVQSMITDPTPAVWCALLGACRIHGNMKIGEIAALKLLEMEPDNPGNYVLISNMYASAGRWEAMEEVRFRMKARGLKKEPACSWIQLGDKVHTFIARDRSHPESDEIYEKLHEIIAKLERDGGYKTETRFVLHNVEEEEKVKMLHGHSERLALAYGLLNTPNESPIRITKNLRVCGDCHTFTKLFSKFFEREVIVRDANRFHRFRDGVCSCEDFW